MSLSRAIGVMLLLHVVAIGGYLAHSLIKEHVSSAAAHDASTHEAAAEDNVGDATRNRPGVYTPRPGEALSQIENAHNAGVVPLPAANGGSQAAIRSKSGQELRPQEHASAGPAANRQQADAQQFIEGGEHPPETRPGEKLYVVAKGENAYSIARKLKVNYEALLKINGIADPKKIRIGQKLRLPTKSKS